MRKLRHLATVTLVLSIAIGAVSGQAMPTQALPSTTWYGPSATDPGFPPHGQVGPPPDAQSTTGPTPPPGLQSERSAITLQAPVVIPGVPAYRWRHGCGPTAAGMVIGYWDNQGFGALVPGDASTQTAKVDRMIASGNSLVDVGTNYTDYCEPLDPPPAPIQPDRSEPPEGDEHPDHCVADFMKTSQSAYWNQYGWSWFSPVGPAMTSYVDWLGRPDYRATTADYYMSYWPYLTWELLRGEIDAGQPMVFLVDTGGDGWTDHFVTVIGYDEGTQSYGCLDTWDDNVHWYAFAPLAWGQPWGVYGGIAFDIGVSNPGVKRVTPTIDDGRDSWYPALNADGSLLAFTSDVDLLNQGVADDQYEIWLHHTETMTYTRVTTATTPGRYSWGPALSADGSKVAFESNVDLLEQGLPSDRFGIWLYDVAAMTYTRVTTPTDPGRNSWQPALSADGSRIAFESDADLLGQGIPDEQFEIWLYDTASITYTRVTTSSLGRDSRHPALSGDGTVVAFESDADLWGQGIPDEQFEIWLYDTAAMTYTRVTTDTQGGRSSGEPSLDASGTLVAFASSADLLGQGIPDGQFEIWLCNMATMSYTRVTTATDSSRDSGAPVLSADGTQLVFYSDADLLGQGIPDEQFEIWLYDLAAATYARITWASESDRGSFYPALSGDGGTIAFHSDSDILAHMVPDEQYEVWLHQVREVYLPLVLGD